MLETLIYTSTATGDRLTDEELGTILSVSRRNNRAAGVTGMVLYAEGFFVQALEGKPEAVKETFVRILGDSRHTRVLKLYKTSIPMRNFPDWPMAYRAAQPGELPPAFFSLTGKNLPAFQEYGYSEEIFLLLKSFSNRINFAKAV